VKEGGFGNFFATLSRKDWRLARPSRFSKGGYLRTIARPALNS
jgi:hypothetical protein